MFNPMQHQLMCEIEGIEHAATNAVNMCVDEQWEYIPECMNVIFKRFHAAFRICQQLEMIPPDPINPNQEMQPSGKVEAKIIESEPLSKDCPDA